MLKRPVIALLGAVRKAACRKLPVLQVIADAFTADSLAGAGLIAAVACRQVLLFLTFHFRLLISECPTPKGPVLAIPRADLLRWNFIHLLKSQMSNSKYQTNSNDQNSKI
jgi:hypothetical protein